MFTTTTTTTTTITITITIVLHCVLNTQYTYITPILHLYCTNITPRRLAPPVGRRHLSSATYLSLSLYIYTHYIYIYIYRSLRVVSDKIASASRNPVQTGNTTTTPPTTTTTTTTTTNNGRCESRKYSSPGLFFDDLHGTNRDKWCRRERHGSSESLGSAVCGFRPWSAIDGTVRGPRSMAPCVARDRWHRAWPARESRQQGGSWAPF